MTSSRPHHSHTSCGDRSTAGTADMAAALARLASGVWLRPCLTDDPALPRTPVIAAWGMGLDSTAMIIEWVARGRPPDLVLTADTGSASAEELREGQEGGGTGRSRGGPYH